MHALPIVTRGPTENVSDLLHLKESPQTPSKREPD
jgi:hypothetical protein